MPKNSILDRIDELREEGELPHQFLLRVANGEPITQSKWKYKYFQRGPRAGEYKSKSLETEEIYPTFQERMEAAKVAAPYFAPKLASTTIKEEKTEVYIADNFGSGGDA